MAAAVAIGAVAVILNATNSSEQFDRVGVLIKIASFNQSLKKAKLWAFYFFFLIFWSRERISFIFISKSVEIKVKYLFDYYREIKTLDFLNNIEIENKCYYREIVELKIIQKYASRISLSRCLFLSIDYNQINIKLFKLFSCSCIFPINHHQFQFMNADYNLNYIFY